MLNIVNGRNYLIDVHFSWGSDSKDIEGTIDNNLNFTQLDENKITAIDIYSTLAYPFFRGSIEYLDQRRGSLLRNMIDMPIVYGKVQFFVVNGSDVPGSDNVVEPEEGENFDEEIFVTGIDTIDDGESEFIKVKINFVSIDYLKFISNMANVSTYDGFEKSTKPLKELLTDMFAAAGLSDRLDVDSITINVEIPYVSSENDTLLTALDYVYRKIFDYDFKEHDGKTYCRIVYDQTKQKYVLWKFEDIGTKSAVDTKIKNEDIKVLREDMSVSSLNGSGKVGLDSRASIKTSGNQSILFEMMDNLKFIDYDYLKNEFTTTVKEKNGESFIQHADEFDSNLSSKLKLVLGNARQFKDNKYERTFSVSRQNASFYDVFTEAIFKSAFIRAESDGSIGRRAGSQILLTFNEYPGTMYEHLDGDYLITAIHNPYGSYGKEKSFRSIMDLYRPYCAVDSMKTKMFD